MVGKVDELVTFVSFFFKQKTAYEIPKRDWSSDVCSSDLSAYHAGNVNALAPDDGRGPADAGDFNFPRHVFAGGPFVRRSRVVGDTQRARPSKLRPVAGSKRHCEHGEQLQHGYILSRKRNGMRLDVA